MASLDEAATILFRRFLFWWALSQESPRQSRAFLEQHQELLIPGVPDLLEQKIAEAEKDDLAQILQLNANITENVQEVALQMRNQVTFLSEITRRGNTIEAIISVYIDTYSFLVLDMPTWLEQEIAHLRSFVDARAGTSESYLLLRSILQKVQNDTSVLPEIRAGLYRMLANTLVHRAIFAPSPHMQDEEISSFIEEAISCYNIVLQAYTREKFPLQWARTEQQLGDLYAELEDEGSVKTMEEETIIHYEHALEIMKRSDDEKIWARMHKRLGKLYVEREQGLFQENMERAVAHLQHALDVYTHAAAIMDWAKIQLLLGIAYRRFVSECRENIERAIYHINQSLTVLTSKDHVYEWAKAQGQLALAYCSRIEDDHADNLELALECHKALLRAFSRQTQPRAWALAHAGLGKIYIERIKGEQWQNSERALRHCRAALKILEIDPTSEDYAEVQYDLGNAYDIRIRGDRSQNIENAIVCHEKALRALTKEAFPERWAGVSSNLGIIYVSRIEGERRTNIERAITLYEAALEVHTLEHYPLQYGRIQFNLATAYAQRIADNPHKNRDMAISHSCEALRVFTRQAFPQQWVHLQANLGVLYLRRTVGGLNENLKRSIAYSEIALKVYTQQKFRSYDCALCMFHLASAYALSTENDGQENMHMALHYYNTAATILTQDSYPYDWAMLQNNIASSYLNISSGQRQENLQCSTEHCLSALQVFTMEAFPKEHRQAQLLRGRAEVERHNWQTAYEAFAAASTVEEFMIRTGAGAVGQDAVLREFENAFILAGFALLQMGREEEAIVMIERGRTHGWATAQALGTFDDFQIKDEKLRVRFLEGRQHLFSTQAILNTSHVLHPSKKEERQQLLDTVDCYHQAQINFRKITEEIKKTQELADIADFPLDKNALLQAAECGGGGHALIYLAATQWGGMAMAAIAAHLTLQLPQHIAELKLPDLTTSFVQNLLVTYADDEKKQVTGGFYYAQTTEAAIKALFHDWQAGTFRAAATNLHLDCLRTGKESTLDAASQKMLSLPEMATIVDQKKVRKNEATWFNNKLEEELLKCELERCLPLLKEAIFTPLLPWLQKQGVTSITLIPCGYLTAFPLTAIILDDGRTLAETFPTSIAPGARSLLRDYPSSIKRNGVYALGDPYPSQQPLKWGEAEALVITSLAHQYNHDGEARIQFRATRDWLIEILQRALVVDASCHGQFNVENFLQSSLKLASSELRLGEVLSHEIDIRGLRLLILSACQTAIPDLRGAVDEIRSLAVGMLQAGADAVLASLWSVNDKATFLLITRFAEEWLPQMDKMPSAQALALAQHWLRTATKEDIILWCQAKLFNRKDMSPMALSTHQVTNENGNRSSIRQALQDVISDTEQEKALYPYANHIYWAGFQINGW